MVNTKLDIHICGPTSVFHFDPHPYSRSTIFFFSGLIILWHYQSLSHNLHRRLLGSIPKVFKISSDNLGIFSDFLGRRRFSLKGSTLNPVRCIYIYMNCTIIYLNIKYTYIYITRLVKSSKIINELENSFQINCNQPAIVYIKCPLMSYIYMFT